MRTKQEKCQAYMQVVCIYRDKYHLYTVRFADSLSYPRTWVDKTDKDEFKTRGKEITTLKPHAKPIKN